MGLGLGLVTFQPSVLIIDDLIQHSTRSAIEN